MNDEIRFSVRKSKIGSIIWFVIAVAWLAGAVICLIKEDALVAAVPAIMGVGCLLMAIVKILRARSFRLDICGDKFYVRSGIIDIQENVSSFTGIIGVSVRQGVLGKIFDYGEIIIDKVGKEWDINLEDILQPYILKEFLETMIKSTANNLIQK